MYTLRKLKESILLAVPRSTTDREPNPLNMSGVILTTKSEYVSLVDSEDRTTNARHSRHAKDTTL